MREFSWLDGMIDAIDNGIRTVFNHHHQSDRQTPGSDLSDISHTKEQRLHTAGLMRVNHTGEVCAQALYQGQALTAKLPNVREQMTQAALEEIDHLAWCETRLSELNSHPSITNPFWYVASFVLGATAGLVGDKYSLGFVAETEKQVTKHLQSHLEKISPLDAKTRAILTQMQLDEAEHAESAISAGAAQLPSIITHLMQLMSKTMTATTYRI